MMNFDWAFVDLETTGLNCHRDEVIEVAATICRHDGSRELFETLVKPSVAVPPQITFLTGINDEMLLNAPLPQELYGKLSALLSGKVIVAHNAPFDLGFLQVMLRETLPNLWIDTIELTKILFPNLSSYSLRYLTRYFQLDTCPVHRASADTDALEQLFFYLLKRAEALTLREVQDIYCFLQDEEKGLAVFFNEILKEKIKSYNFAQPLPQEGLKQQIEQLAGQMSLKQAPKEHGKKDLPSWDPQELVRMFLPQGAIANGFSEYQERPEQIQMMKAVAKVFSQERYLLVEAGTGVGKSLAYLVPALTWALSQQEKVVVATHTIALQEQLWHSDIAFLRQNLPFSFQAAILKGRGNYFCLHKWKAVKDSAATLNWNEKVLMARLANWLNQEQSGDRDSINLRGWEAEVFRQLASTRETCLGAQCPFYEDCFYQQAREKAQAADLLIVNHSLLLSDVKIEASFLPAYHYLIIDEAHHLEEEGTKQFTDVFSLLDFQKRISYLLKKKETFFKPGLSFIWSNYAALPKEIYPEVKEIIKEIESCAKTLQLKSEEIVESITVPRSETIRVNLDTRQDAWWQSLTLLFDNLMASTDELLLQLTRLANRLSEDCSEAGWENSLKDLRVYQAELKEDLDLVKRFFHSLEDNVVYWLEYELKRKEILLNLSPLNIAELFRDQLFADKTTVVLTSATLCIAEDFGFLTQQYGLPEELVDTLKIHSPFLYDEQSLLLIDNSLPDPAHTGEEAYNQALEEALCAILQATGGRTLVLFTSHKQLQNMYNALKGTLQEKGWEIYADGINGHRSTLLAELKNNPAAIVFGANTFWEGINLPGSSLTSVVMVRLPFWPPNMPMVEARIEALQKEGKDGFYHYSLPQAVLRFRQGYGRLIRTINDCGVVAVLDNRLLKKQYGKVFLNSLPQQKYISGNTQKIVENIKEWLKRSKNDKIEMS
ncbi:MAG: helicase C-terminal domain-containing protein [Peptococcia bacterium]|jgi:ATP-dependent DNA helicase DinG